jgi:hypothetical protein
LIDYGGEPETAQHFCHQWRELALLGNTSWGCMHSAIRWWLPSAVFRATIHGLAESNEAGIFFKRLWACLNF